ncbi:MAG: peptidase C39 family protein, partial [Hyphomicrobiaceae bacterium]|nr:peptidase C39 family protein [Hyphomicrobiaceae bacterium]
GNGALAIVLISGWTMFAKQVPHWILVWGADDDHLFIHDPWVEDSRDESHVDAASLPIPRTLFDRMARWGRAGLKAAIIVTRSHGDAAG